VFCAVSHLIAGELFAAEASTVVIGKETAALLQHSMAADGRHALAWVPRTDEPIDWSLLSSDPQRFASKYEVREIWIVDLAQTKRLAILGGPKGYVRPGSHRTLNVTWAPLDDGRRFAIAAYDWKWGTDTLFLLDIGADTCHEAQIGPFVDRAIGVFISQTLRPKKNSAFDTRYLVGELPARGHQTGFSGTETIRLPFSTKVRGEDDPIAEGIVTLQLSRTSGAPTARVLKITAGLPSDRFADDTRLAKADAALNAVYNALSRQLDEQPREILRNEQRRWLEKRDKKTIDAKIGGVENPRIVRDAVLRQLTEERTADLRARLKAKR